MIVLMSSLQVFPYTFDGLTMKHILNHILPGIKKVLKSPELNYVNPEPLAHHSCYSLIQAEWPLPVHPFPAY